MGCPGYDPIRKHGEIRKGIGGATVQHNGLGKTSGIKSDPELIRYLSHNPKQSLWAKLRRKVN
jgi:hypothetical protein